MKTINELLLLETYVNLFAKDKVSKLKWKSQVWDILQKSYAEIGGIAGSGFMSPDDMVQNVPFWKLNVKNGNVISVAMYKDANGRKLIATGTDGSVRAVEALAKNMVPELERSFGEKSGKSLGFTMKNIEWNVLKQFLMTPEKAQSYLKKKLLVVDASKLSEKDKFAYKKFPQLRPYFYTRLIGDKTYMKIMMGSPQLKIKN